MPTRSLFLYDSIVNDIPADAEAIAGYVAGAWPTFHEPWFQKHRAKHKISIAIHANENALALDVEKGDEWPIIASRLGGWVLRQVARGVYRPWIYTSASNVDQAVRALRADGVERSEYRIWSAHYTGVPHLCGPRTCRECLAQADVTQYTDRARGANLDESLVSDGALTFTKPDPHPEYKILDKTHRLSGRAEPGGISELGRIKAYDVYRAHGQRVPLDVRYDCQRLFDRLWTIVHADAPVNSPLAGERWAQYHRGKRGKILHDAALGKR